MSIFLIAAVIAGLEIVPSLLSIEIVRCHQEDRVYQEDLRVVLKERFAEDDAVEGVPSPPGVENDLLALVEVFAEDEKVKAVLSHFKEDLLVQRAI